MKKIYAVFLFLLFFLFYCSKEKKKEAENFYSLPLTIGNEYQLISLKDNNIIINSTITDTVFRTDRQKLFQQVCHYFDGSSDTLYLYHKDGYLIGTHLDTLFRSSDSTVFIPQNPFHECKLAKINPCEGDIWKHTFGGEEYFYASKIDSFQSYYNVMKDVFQYDLFHQSDGLTFMSVLYANRLGHVGTKAYNSFLPDMRSDTFAASYIKINGKEYGKKILFKSKNFNNSLLQKYSQKEIQSYLYQVITGRKKPDEKTFIKTKK